MSTPGRNDPCPCGSGKKFKRCCLGQEATGPFTSEDRQRALHHLLHRSGEREFQEDREIAESVFWGASLEGRTDEEIQQALALKQSHAVFDLWFAVDVPIEHDKTVLDHLLEEGSGTLGPGERDYLERLRPTHVRLYEVQEVRLNEGLTLLDLWTGERVWVRERLATQQLARWDLLAARLLREHDGVPVIEGIPLLYPPLAKDEILNDLRRAYRAFSRQSPGQDAAAFFKRAGVLVHDFWIEYVALRPLPTIVTAEGDPVVLTKVIFDLLDRSQVERALASCQELQRQGESFVWLENAGNRLRTLGTFRLGGNRLTLESMSRERAERGSELIERIAGSAVKYRATRYEDVKQALNNLGPTPEPRPSEIPPELEAKLAAEFYEQHYRKWIDQPIPALGHRTPRHAARLKTVRPKLIALLKDIENRFERERREGRPAYDIAWMWQGLGLERP